LNTSRICSGLRLRRTQRIACRVHRHCQANKRRTCAARRYQITEYDDRPFHFWETGEARDL
jgi:hypothetical protein